MADKDADRDKLREERLAAALRDNLKRRKAQARAVGKRDPHRGVD